MPPNKRPPPLPAPSQHMPSPLVLATPTLPNHALSIPPGGPVQGPGAFDGISARCVERAGFPFVFMSGFCTSAAKVGSLAHVQLPCILRGGLLPPAKKVSLPSLKASVLVPGRGQAKRVAFSSCGPVPLRNSALA